MATPTSPHQANLPTRTSTNTSGEEAIPSEDSSETTKLFNQRLQAWKGAVANLEDYVEATQKSEKSISKEVAKILKTVNSPLKEGHHFHQQAGGVAGMFESIRSNTQAISNSHEETAKTLDGSVLPIFKRLHSEIKNKIKELDKGAGKGSKTVDKARNESQKYIELLGQHASSFESRGANVKPNEDPYLLQRQIYHRLHNQVVEENNNRDDMLAVQNEFGQFEAHVLHSLQQGIQQFNQVMAHSADQQRNMYGDMAATSSRIPPDFEWKGFIQRNNNTLIDPNSPKRSIENITFPNQDHPSTRPLIAGSLERKGKLLKRYETAYYVVTPSKYLHEFKSDDDFAKDPSPENTLYLPDCLIGAVDGSTFHIKGKDQSKGALSKMSMSHDFSFKAHTVDDARKWHDIMLGVSGGQTASAPGTPVVQHDNPMSPVSPTGSQTTGSTGTATTSQNTTLAGSQLGEKQGHEGQEVGQSEKDFAGAPAPGVTTGTTGSQPYSEKSNDYAPL